MKTTIFHALILSTALLACYALANNPIINPHPNANIESNINNTSNPATSKVKYIAEAKSFIQKHNFENQFCLLINMSLPSGSNRLFVYDLKKDSILYTGLVTHGNCMKYWLDGRRYDNQIGCGCTSLGKYKIGMSYHGKFGLAYKLYGLDSSNSNAFKRFIVLHSHSCVPLKETSNDICQSNGCPTVNPNFLNVLQKKIDASKRPILLWIYE